MHEIWTTAIITAQSCTGHSDKKSLQISFLLTLMVGQVKLWLYENDLRDIMFALIEQ